MGKKLATFLFVATHSIIFQVIQWCGLLLSMRKSAMCYVKCEHFELTEVKCTRTGTGNIEWIVHELRTRNIEWSLRELKTENTKWSFGQLGTGNVEWSVRELGNGNIAPRGTAAFPCHILTAVVQKKYDNFKYNEISFSKTCVLKVNYEFLGQLKNAVELYW